jgi:hypothetical protein
MEDHDLVAAALDSESAAARSKIPCSAESIDPPDHRALLLAELGADAKIIRDALRARPDVTTEQIRASWAHFEQRISAGLCTAGAFFNAIKRGQLHTAPPDPQQPLDPEAYRDRPGFALGGAPPGPPEVESIGDIARRILPADASGPDWIYVQTRLARGDTETGALASLSTRRKGVRR